MVKGKEAKELKKIEKKQAKKVAKEAGYMSASHYFQSLADPFNNHGEKIPDDITYPSSTFTIVDRRVLTLNSSGFGAICYGNAGGAGAVIYGGLIPTNQITVAAENEDNNRTPKKSGFVEPKPSATVVDHIVGTQTPAGSGASATNVFPTVASGGQTPFSFAEWLTAVGVPTLYSKARLVSGGVSIDYLGTALGAKGRITIASVPRRTLREEMQNGALLLTQIQNLVGAKIIAVNKLQGGSVVYHPLDGLDFVYTDQDTNYDVTSITNHDVDCSLGGEIYIVIDGAEASATCQITGCFNYEAIPKKGTLNLVQPTYSRSDPVELSMSMNAIEKVPTATVGNKAARNLEEGNTQLPPAAAPEVSKAIATEEQREEGEEDSFMTKILDGAEGVLSKAPGIIGKATPLVRQALGFLGV